ncbi:MAG: hypothetical protein ACJARD_001223 [Alphaproteobacteria bacterium]|jgi:hypothetical protein
MSTNNISEYSGAVTNGYARWNEQVLHSKNVINSSQYKINASYDSIRDFDKQLMTGHWIQEIASIMAKNPQFRQAIEAGAQETGDKLSFAQSLLSYPQIAIRYDGASNALIDGLNHIERFDYQYRNLSHAFEDAARGRRNKTRSKARNISNIDLSIYASKNNTPSVAEQMLSIAAIKILSLENNPNIRVAYNSTLLNMPVENCLHHAQRNSAQCKAASHDKHDLSFCMAKHAIGETSQCFSWILP